ncbi:MAG: hypothetical protein US74_C0006G0005 [Parcubacteria group bacterium GW2011_GWA2_38_13]|nr:MAG: hypothetical protein US74_C0006G0005 [Parcubacteria group bacterium GW2011_GWA2_38_13]
MQDKKINIIVLMGGPSDEYEVSLSTGKQILNSLDKKNMLFRRSP